MEIRTVLVVLLLSLATDAEAAKIVVPRDYATIQEAADAAQPGDVIHVRPGEYAGASINERLTIRGDPGTIINSPEPQLGLDAFPLGNTRASGSTFSGLMIDGVRYGIFGRASDVTDVTVRNCIISNTNTAVRINFGDGWKIKDTDIHNSASGVRGFVTHNVKVTDNVIIDSSHAVRNLFGNGWIIKNNVIDGLPLRPFFHAVGIDIFIGLDNRIKNNWLRHTGSFDPDGARQQFYTGIALTGAEGAPATGNILVDNYVEISVPDALPFPFGAVPDPFEVAAYGITINSIGGTAPDTFATSNRIVNNDLCNSTVPIVSSINRVLVNGPGVFADTNKFVGNEFVCDDDD